MKNKEPQRFKHIFKALIVEVLEGNGVDIPYEIVRYVITEDGSIIGKINHEWMN